MQTLLPFKETTLPAQHVEWLRLANAAEYVEKKGWFYPFKSRFCHAHGIADGMDLQEITLKCWCGDGIYRGMDNTRPPKFWEPCNRCNGSGIYMVKKILLVRWLVGGMVFHEPSPFVYHTGMPVKERFDGLIRHSFVTGAVGHRAMERLMLRYEPETLKRLYLFRFSNWRALRRVKLRHVFYRLNLRLRACFGQVVDDVPF